MAKQVTLEDIARQVGVSKNTVSLVIRGRPGVGDAVRERVLDVAKDLGYQRRTMVENHKARNILVIYPSWLASASGKEPPAFGQNLIHQMDLYARSLGYHLLAHSVMVDEEQALVRPKVLESIRMMGIIALEGLSVEYLRMLMATGCRMTLVEQAHIGLQANIVSADNITGAYLLTRHLLEMGHSDIQFFGEIMRDPSMTQRYMGYAYAMRERGMLLPVNRYQNVTRARWMVLPEKAAIKSAFFELLARPSAVVCGDDHVAYRLISVLAEEGLRVPDDVSVVGFMDSPAYETFTPRLTTYHMDEVEMAHTAVDSLVLDRNLSPRKIAVCGYPVFRDSVMAAVNR